MGNQRRLKSPRGVERITEEYLRGCEGRERCPTLTGLALALGFSSREAFEKFVSQQQEAPLGEALRRACSLVEEETLQAAYRKETASGARFLLQTAFGYGDKAGRDLGPITVRVEGEEA